jgi:hypothetical protein
VSKRAAREDFNMKKFYGFALAAVLIGACSGAAIAAPPTVVPSPGYDARLQEQRSLGQASQARAALYSPAPRRKHKARRSRCW